MSVSARCYHFFIPQPKNKVHRSTEQQPLRAFVPVAKRSLWFPTAAAAYFLLAGVLFVPHLGVQNDEALFASPLFAPKDWFYRIRLFHSDLALLLLSYLGTLKTLLYKPIFRCFGVSAASIRVPMIAAGALGIYLFYRLLDRIAGQRAARIGTTLLAADSIYLLTTCFDWGPVVLQHLLIVGGMLLAVRFHQGRGRAALFGAFFLLGLAVWDKALALWILTAVFTAALAVAGRAIWAAVNLRNILTAILGFGVGASPFLIYNFTHHFGSVGENSGRDFTDIAGRARLLENTLNGQGMFGWLVEEDSALPRPHNPETPLEQFSAGISTIARHPRHNLAVYGFILALLVAPFARGHSLRAILFAAIAMAIAWLQMATTANAGGTIHHIILLWPLPAMLMGIALAAASRRLGRGGVAAAVAVTAILAGSELLVTNEYYALMVRNGGTVQWTDAVFKLSDYLKSQPPAKAVACTDWGILDTLRLLNRGSLRLRWGADDEGATLAGELADGGTLFVGHPTGREVFPGKLEKLTERAAALGYRREVDAEIADGFGRPTFQVFRFVR